VTDFVAVFVGYTLTVSLAVLLYFAMTATEIQNIQVADGDVCRKLPIPIYMIFPRLFTCPTLATSNFKIGKSFVVTVEL